MKILVTGGLGHIGSKLIREYIKREDVDVVRVLDNMLVQRYCSLFDLPEISGKRYEFIQGDILNVEEIRKAVKDIDIVIHLAGITDAPSTIDKPEATFKSNFDGAWNVLTASMNADIKKFLFPSTTSVYGEAEGIVDENSSEEVYKPASPYAEAKRKAEKLMKDVYKENGFNTTVLRMGTIFGTSIGMRFHTAVNKFCYLAALGKPLTVWDSALNSKRPYLGLNDNIRAFQFLETRGKPGELYNVVTKNFSIEDIINSIKKVVPDVKIEITKSPLLNQKPYEVSNEKIRQEGFEFRDELDEGVRKTIELFKGVKNN